jgi:carbon monoxide dehydrogenase subunit G
MPVVEEDVFIARPPQELFEFLTTAENLPVWDSSIIEAEQVDDGPIQLGTRYRGVSKILGRRFEWTTRVTELKSPTFTIYQSVEGKLHFTVTHSLEPENAGTRFRYKIEADAGLGGVFGRIADPIVERAQRRTVRGSLDTLAELLAQPNPEA